jgi:hydroxyacylglutathione hydrolase
MRVETISTEGLGNRSYVAWSGTHAVVIDPQRDIDRVEDALARLGVRVDVVVETHIHNDYVTGGLELARRHGARYAVNAADQVSFDRLGVQDGDVLDAGTLRVTVMATPGHTDTHLAYVVTDGSGQPPAVFTGGSLLYGSVGRTDLIDPVRTEELTRAQFRSVHRLAAALPDETPVFPTHGFGSFCSGGSTAGGWDSTIGTERRRNDAFVTIDEDSFVQRLVANLTAYPAYYHHMGPLNRRGPTAPDLSPPTPVDPAELSKRIAAGEWVVDLRDRVAYAGDHLSGTVSIELEDQFAIYLGWLAPWRAAITLVGADQSQVADAQRQLMRIGIDRLAGAATGTLDDVAGAHPRRAYPRVTFADLPQRADTDVILDVRRDDERAAGFIPGSAHLPLHELLSRVDELPAHRQLWIHCGSGLRASIAASLLDRAGLTVVYIDDDYGRAVALGLADN